MSFDEKLLHIREIRKERTIRKVSPVIKRTIKKNKNTLMTNLSKIKDMNELDELIKQLEEKVNG